MQTSSGVITPVAVFPEVGIAMETMTVEIGLTRATAVSHNTAFKWIINCCQRSKWYTYIVVKGCLCQGRSDGGYIGIYTPKSVYLTFFMWLFCLLGPFIPTQIKFLATPLVSVMLVKLLRYWYSHQVCAVL